MNWLHIMVFFRLKMPRGSRSLQLRFRSTNLIEFKSELDLGCYTGSPDSTISSTNLSSNTNPNSNNKEDCLHHHNNHFSHHQPNLKGSGEEVTSSRQRRKVDSRAKVVDKIDRTSRFRDRSRLFKLISIHGSARCWAGIDT